MNIKSQIKSYWERISKIESHIEELANRGINYSIESNKRKEMIKNVKHIELRQRGDGK